MPVQHLACSNGIHIYSTIHDKATALAPLPSFHVITPLMTFSYFS